ncbi:MAG: hypothetical protein IJU59_07745 [Firmicutes bacterium]|nr:hypothetical protein [Bacillota bacterium]
MSLFSRKGKMTKAERMEKMRARLAEMKEFEDRLHNEGVKYIAGVDEVGRGPLAGPVVTAAVVLPEDFDVPDDSKFLATLSGREDAVNISEKIISFCLDRGIERRVSNHVGLALEEMSVIIIDQGFGDGKPHSIDIKLFVKDGQITVRLRDDCKAFNTSQRIAIMDPEDKTANIGIRILHSIARNVDHYSTLDMNYLIMHI